MGRLGNKLFRCPDCNLVKSKFKRSKGLCRQCYRKSDYKQRHALMRARHKIYYEKNKEKILLALKKYREENPEKVRIMMDRKNAKRNSEKRYDVIAYNKRVKKAIPKWLSKEEKRQIKEFYRNRPEGYDVDHIIPLNSPYISGLHVLSNLQYLPKSINRGVKVKQARSLNYIKDLSLKLNY
jgi:hypothetical protein